jgi:hypothetical protein
MVHFFHEGGGPYLKGENPFTPSSINNTRLIDSVPSLSANGPLRFIKIIYIGQAHKSNTGVGDIYFQAAAWQRGTSRQQCGGAGVD